MTEIPKNGLQQEEIERVNKDRLLSTLGDVLSDVPDAVVVGGTAMRLQYALKVGKFLREGSGDLDFCVSNGQFIEAKKLSRVKSWRYSTLPASQNVPKKVIENRIHRNSNENMLELVHKGTGKIVDFYLFPIPQDLVDQVDLSNVGINSTARVLSSEELYRVRLLSLNREISFGHVDPLDLYYIRILDLLSDRNKLQQNWVNKKRSGTFNDWEKSILSKI